MGIVIPLNERREGLLGHQVLHARRHSVPEQNGIWRALTPTHCQSMRHTVTDRFTLPTGPAKPAGSSTGIPDRFGRKPVQTGRSQI